MRGGEFGDGEIIECTLYNVRSTVYTALLGEVVCTRRTHKSFSSSSFCSNQHSEDVSQRQNVECKIRDAKYQEVQRFTRRAVPEML